MKTMVIQTLPIVHFCHILHIIHILQQHLQVFGIAFAGDWRDCQARLQHPEPGGGYERNRGAVPHHHRHPRHPREHPEADAPDPQTHQRPAGEHSHLIVAPIICSLSPTVMCQPSFQAGFILCMCCHSLMRSHAAVYTKRRSWTDQSVEHSEIL